MLRVRESVPEIFNKATCNFPSSCTNAKRPPTNFISLDEGKESRFAVGVALFHGNF